MKDLRPNPDELLKAVTEEAARTTRGRLKIFFGACAGVGKTYAMLQAAAQRQAEGVSVVIGIVETHGRPETGDLLDGLPALPLKRLDHREHVLQEFDLDGALSAGYQLVLVDELAHSNVPGSRHAKRWRDVEELLDAGIDIYTTLNVQHLDSLNDVVGGITGIRVRETVPDRIFDAAAEVILIDLPPDDLLVRLGAGKVYLDAAAQRARQNFFRKGNLFALRELALRRVADRVNSDVRSYRISNAIQTVWPTHERLMVCIRTGRSQETLLREGARLAQRLQADWIVVHVDELRRGRHPEERENLRALAESAKALGAEFTNLAGEEVAETLLDYAHTRNVTKMVIGRAVTRGWRPWRAGVAERIGRANPEIGLILIGHGGPTPPAARPRQPAPSPAPSGYLPRLALATLSCGLATLVASWLLRVFDLSNVVMLFLLTVVLVALRLGRAAGAWSALLCVALFDFFFVEPRWSFTVADTQYLFTFTLMLTVALVISQLAARLRAEAKMATEGERRAAALARVARDLSAAIKAEQIVAICTDTIAPLLSVRVALILPDLSSKLIAVQNTGFVDLTVAQWVYDHTQPAGLGTETLSGASARYIPLKAPMRVRGVLALYPADGAIPADPDDRRLLDAFCSSIAMALERIHFVEIAQDTLVKMGGERLRNALLAAISHDLKTPLTAIRGLAETLEQPERLPREQHVELASAIRVQAEELQRLVLNLLDLARMQSEGVRLNRDWHALDEIIGSALARSTRVLAGRRVKTDLPADLPLVDVDALLMERVFVNLLDNAAKYAGTGATILLKARASDDAIHVFLEDDGPGFQVRDTEMLFEPFERGQKESSNAGVGLGLALCRRIIGAHGGAIRAEQLQPHGACFEVRLPRGNPPEIEPEEAEPWTNPAY
ncbi:MAG TPA: sensor histidine kinase KdpD [Burkholderiaceae bacterium]|nr:sensor histidine kinase KdpD [Burkholderiaceae bacterium]